MSDLKPTKKILKIRKNIRNGKWPPYWTVVVDGQEKTVKNFYLHVPTFNMSDPLPDGTLDFCFACYYDRIEWKGDAIIVK